MSWLFSVHWVLIASLWYFGSGILHDILVFIHHKGKFDMAFFRLLTDGHVLMLSGAVVFVCYLMMLNKIQCGGVISMIVAAFMLLYCFLMLPLPKSLATIAISIMLIVVAIKAISNFPNIYDIMQNYK